MLWGEMRRGDMGEGKDTISHTAVNDGQTARRQAANKGLGKRIVQIANPNSAQPRHSRVRIRLLDDDIVP